LFPEPNTENFRIRPLSCQLLIDEYSSRNKLKRIRVRDPNRGEILLVRNVTDQFLVSIHKNRKHWKGYTILQTGTHYSIHTTQLIKHILQPNYTKAKQQQQQPQPGEDEVDQEEGQEELQQKDSRRFMEVGASLGWFSLLARSLGIQYVDVFEPNLVNVLRICQSLKANHWLDTATNRTNTVRIYPYGITAEDGTVLFQYPPDEEGSTSARINTNWGHKSQAFALDSFARERNWLERNDQIISILKIDVGHHAPLVIAGAEEFLKSGMVKSIIFDMSIRHMGDKEDCLQAISQLMESGFELAMWGDDKFGPSNPPVWPQDETLPQNILKAMHRPGHHFEMSFYWTLKEP
jgi:FkbM family methyltransferase